MPVDPSLSHVENLEIYDYRRRQQDNLVEVYQVEREPSTYICQGQDFLRVKTERIPFRLSDLKTVSFREALYVIRETLLGCRMIHNFQGPVLINDDMIGFTPAGKVKVWLNSNFAKNSRDVGQQRHD